MARAATSPELALFRSPGQWSRVRAAIYTPTTVYTGRINQSFSSLDKLLEVIYDGGVGTLADVYPDMTVLFGSTAGAWDKGIARVRGIDATKVYIGESADLSLANDQYITIIDDFGLWAKPILISGGVPYMDGGIAYSDQYTNWLPAGKMGPNLVLKKTGSTVSHLFNWTSSYVPGSTISAYSVSAPGSSAISGGTTSTPTITWNSTGWKKVILTLTAANGKSDFFVRYVYIWDKDHLPPLARLDSNPKGSVDSGGWEFSITLFDNASLSQVRDHALVILFSEDHYGAWDDATEISIGPVSGAENILAMGWIGKESIEWDPEGGSVSFTAYGAHHFLQEIPAWPFGVEFTTGTPDSWTKVKDLTIDLGLYVFLQWATTAPRIMDITLTSDTRLTKEVSSLASKLWAQMQEIAFDQIYARPLVNCLNQLYIEIHPQLTATGSRTWPTILELLPEDYERPIELERSTMDELSILDLSGVLINSSGSATAFFSLAPGHSHSHYGDPDVQPKRLLSSQAQANTLAGLYRSWANNPYKSIPLSLKNNRLIDIAPRQKCTITIDAADTKRGISYTGGIIPTSVEWSHDTKTGFLHTEVNFEAETGEGRAENGDVPGSTDISVPPLKPLPPLPPLDPIFPGGISGSPGGPVTVVFHNDVAGMLVAENFDTSPVYSAINSGLPVGYPQLINWFHVFPSGAVYVAFIPGSNNLSFVARAPSVGGTFTVLFDSTAPGDPDYLWGIGFNPLIEQIGFIKGVAGANRFYVGSGSSYTAGLALNDNVIRGNGISYGFGAWLLTKYESFLKVSSSGTSLLATGTPHVSPSHLRAGSTGITYHPHRNLDIIIRGDNNLGTNTDISTGNQFGVEGGTGNDLHKVTDCDPTGQYIMGKALAGGKGKSSDFGVTWGTLGSLPFGNYSFGYAGPGSSGPRFIASGAVIRYSPDFGVTWVTKENSSLLALTPYPDVDLVQVIGY